MGSALMLSGGLCATMDGELNELQGEIDGKDDS
jgi:hypothetical protein